MGSQNGHIQVYVDRALWIDHTDSAPLPSGTIGVSSVDGSSVMVDDVIVHHIQGTLPSAQVVAPPPAANAEPFVAPADMSVDQVDPNVEPLPQQVVQISDPQVSFTVEGGSSANIDAGQCVTTAWSVQNALSVYYQGLAVASDGFIDECPGENTDFVLEVVRMDGQSREYVVSVTVQQPQGVEPEPQQGGGLPDLRVTGVGISPTDPAAGQEVWVMLTIANRGDADAYSFTVIWAPEGSFVGCSWDIVHIAAGEELVLPCNYPGYPQAGNFDWGARVDSENDIAESEEGNNTKQGPITIR
jgi:hypothetical protein